MPNHVLSQDAFNLAKAPGLTNLQKDRHFSNRHLWLRDINGKRYFQRIDDMVTRWWELGLVEAIVPPKGSGLPNPTFVETGCKSGVSKDPTLTMVKNSLALDKYENGESEIATLSKSPKDVRNYKTFHREEI